jgi:DNA-directed RNA polymerase subunit H (RpoH/RPB5)
MSIKDLQYIIYRNAHELLKYRGYANVPEIKSQVEFTSAITRDSFYKITGTRAELKVDDAAPKKTSRAPTTELSVFIFSTIHLLRASTRKTFFGPNSKHVTGPSVFITKDDGYHSKILKISEKYPTEVGLYSHLIMNIPQHETFIPISIISEDEVKKLCDMVARDVETLPILRTQDPVCFWLGARVGDVVMIERPSDYAGTGIVYRRVMEGRTSAKKAKKQKKTQKMQY